MYLDISNSNIYYLLSLQSWLFAMHYTERAMSSSLWVNFFSYGQLSFIKWSVIIMFATVIITFYSITMYSFPGYYDKNSSMVDFYNWFYNTLIKLAKITDYICLSLNFLSIVITIFAVIKILKITSTLSLTN